MDKLEPVKLANAFDAHATDAEQSQFRSESSATVVFNYEAREDDELSIQKGEKLYIINKFPDEWYLVQNAKVLTNVLVPYILHQHVDSRAILPYETGSG